MLEPKLGGRGVGGGASSKREAGGGAGLEVFEPLHGGGKQLRNAPPLRSSCPDNTSAVKTRGSDEALLRLWMTLSLGVSSIVLDRLGAESGSSIGGLFFFFFSFYARPVSVSIKLQHLAQHAR